MATKNDRQKRFKWEKSHFELKCGGLKGKLT